MNNLLRVSDADTRSLSRAPEGMFSGAHGVTPFLVLYSAILTVIAMVLYPASADANACSDQPALIDVNKLTLGPNHHPIGAFLPARAEFNQPDRCEGDIWYFDKNGNGIADPAEVRVFGSKRQVDCLSCHGESLEQKSRASASVFLRQDAATLCLVCHNL